MDAITRNVRDIDAAERRVLEQLLGQTLAENQQLVIRVMDVAGPQNAASKPEQTLDDWTRVYDGLSDDEIEAVDAIAKTRANLTRHLP
jgi:hypothetical protein